MLTRIEIKQRAKRALSSHYGIGLGLYILPVLCAIGGYLALMLVLGIPAAILFSGSSAPFAQTLPNILLMTAMLVVPCVLVVMMVGAEAGYIKLYRDLPASVSEPFRAVRHGFWRKLGGMMKMVLFLWLWMLIPLAGSTALLVAGIAQGATSGILMTTTINVMGTLRESVVYVPEGYYFGYLALMLVAVAIAVVKELQYAATPYILAEYTDVKGGHAIRLSKRIMQGHCWELFVAELSFFWWMLLGAISFGIVSIFYATPYMYITLAGFYTKFRDMALLGGVVAPEELGDSLMAVPAPEPETE